MCSPCNARFLTPTQVSPRKRYLDRGQFRIKVGAIDAAALGPFNEDEKKKSLLYLGCDFYGWYNFGKII